ncbi:MAG TPA: HD domain-containing phosphohydrolase [Candidatus Dormibacteraeota bacterium]|nr:HD domain-containing phosphohydrolase [Candidatus Dormibacteraeota bacterium]
MADIQKVPADFHQAMFRIAAIAFVTAASVNVGSSFIGAPHFDYTGILIVGILSYGGALVSWFFPWHRLPVERFLVVIVLPGLALLGFMLMYTGGVRSHILPIFIAPAVFMAAAYGFRTGAAIALFTAVTATLPLFINGWDDYYLRMVIVLAVSMMLCAYISAQVRQALLKESERRRQEQEESSVATIGALAAALDAKDRYTEAHSRETAQLAVNVGKRLGLQADQLRLLEYGALLHDIGKIGIPGYILQKPGPLTPEEFAIMREHPVIGERILASVPFLAPLGPIVRAEHERWNGTGYPDGLKGEEIPIQARIIHGCDAFHAMASDRAYRKALPMDAIIAEFRRESGQQFDPRVVDVLLELIEQETPEVNAPEQTTDHAVPDATPAPRSWAQHMQTVEGLGQQLARATSIEDICNRIGETIVTLLPHDQCRVLLVNEEGNRLEIVYLNGNDREEYRAVTPANASVAVGEGIAGWVAESRRGVVLGDTERHPKAAHVAGTTVVDESMLAVPVVFEDEVLAVIVVLKIGLNQYSLDQLRLLTILANQAAVSMANARLIDRLASAASIDALTGLLNRPAFEDAVNKQLLRPPSWGSLLMLDVVDLRETNEAYGHRAGDAVLKRIARAVRSSIRSDDLASRWIGDNFAILAPGIDAAGAQALAARIDAGLQSERISIHSASVEYHGDVLAAQDLVAAALKSLALKRDAAAA